MTTPASAAPLALDDLLAATNARYVRVRHGATGLDGAAAEAAAASVESAHYVEAFWPRVIAAIAADPARLGSELVHRQGGQNQRVTVDDVRQAMRAADGVDAAAGATPAAIKAAAFAPLVVMSRLLNAATTAFAEELESGRCPLAYAVEPARYVSLRALLPLRAAPADAVGANAPTLVMGGTATALGLCWNLLYRMPRAWQVLYGQLPPRSEMETLWDETRELLFRIGSGSLAAFVALASACSSNSAALVWDGAFDLALARRAERHVWILNEDLHGRYRARLAQVEHAQQGCYVGCAALYARADALPLAVPPADPIDSERPAQVFSEMLRWVTAVARAEYFPLFD